MLESVEEISTEDFQRNSSGSRGSGVSALETPE
jgi:hypothetical protein